jgi:hypothetical protein
MLEEIMRLIEDHMLVHHTIMLPLIDFQLLDHRQYVERNFDQLPKYQFVVD